MRTGWCWHLGVAVIAMAACGGCASRHRATSAGEPIDVSLRIEGGATLVATVTNRSERAVYVPRVAVNSWQPPHVYYRPGTVVFVIALVPPPHTLQVEGNPRLRFDALPSGDSMEYRVALEDPIWEDHRVDPAPRTPVALELDGPRYVSAEVTQIEVLVGALPDHIVQGLGVEREGVLPDRFPDDEPGVVTLSQNRIIEASQMSMQEYARSVARNVFCYGTVTGPAVACDLQVFAVGRIQVSGRRMMHVRTPYDTEEERR